MGRIPYRITLPVVQLALYLVLIWLGCYYRQTWQAQFEHWITSRPVAADEWIPTWVDGPTPLPEQLALGINAPAVFVSGRILDYFRSQFHDGASEELAQHSTTAVLIPVLWFFLGRRLERRTVSAMRPSIIGKVLVVTMLAFAALVALLIAVSLVGRFRELLAERLLTLAWAIGAILVLWRELRRWRLGVATK